MRILLSILFISSLINLSAQEGNEMQLLSHWSDSIVNDGDAWVLYNEVWGMAVNNHEYAVVGSFVGTHIIDVTNPENPYEAFLIPGAFSNTAVVHRDYHDHNGYLYAVCDEGPSTLQIMDLQYLPDSIPVVYNSNALLTTSHNIFIDSSTNKLYHTGGSSDGAVTIFDLANPIAPVEIGHYRTFGNQDFHYAHDVHVRGDTAYLNCGTDGLVIADFSDPDTVITLAILSTSEYPQSGYNHSGWLTEDGKTYVMADETNGKDVKVFNIENLPEIDLLTTINPGNEGNHIAHNPIIKGKYLYTAYYNNGIQVWDIEDPSNPVKTNYFIPSEEPDTWGVYPFLPSGNILISDINTGLYILSGIDTVTSVTNIISEPISIDIYPSPTKNQINIDTDIIKKEAIYSIYHINGSLVQQGQITKNVTSIQTINLDDKLTNGIYLLKIESKQTVFNGKFVIEK